MTFSNLNIEPNGFLRRCNSFPTSTGAQRSIVIQNFHLALYKVTPSISFAFAPHELLIDIHAHKWLKIKVSLLTGDHEPKLLTYMEFVFFMEKRERKECFPVI